MNERLAELTQLWNKSFDGALSPAENLRLAELMSDAKLMEAFAEAQALRANKENVSGLSDAEWSPTDRRLMAIFLRRSMMLRLKPLGLVLLAGVAIAGAYLYTQSGDSSARPNLSLEGESFGTLAPAQSEAAPEEDNRSHEIHTGRITVLVDQIKQSHASVKILDASGEIVRQLYAGTLAAGKYRFQWNGRDAQGSKVDPGAYTIQIQSASGIETRHLTIRQKK
jgi:hypothetical protein